MDVRTTATSSKLFAAVEENQKNITLTPYYAACLRHLPQQEKQKYTISEKLPKNLTREEQLKYACGILMQDKLPLEISEHILSFLPLMNEKRAKKNSEIAYQRHGDGLEVEVQANDEPPQSRRHGT